tara:strand:- start:658 stop:1041 length:384 start_codon:yes stop_codon:yes gene_type:complete
MDLNQVTLPSLDVATSIVFYQKLGLELIVRSLPHYARLECPNGVSTLSVHEVESMPAGNTASIYFECDKLDEKVDELVAKGINFDEMPADRSWLWREARLKDPDGNKIILFYGGENRKNPPWRVNEL